MIKSITINQKRFLIAWTIFHSFALFVNLFKIDGSLKMTLYSPIFNVFTTTYQTGAYDDFWPFVPYTSNGIVLLTEKSNDDPWIWKDLAQDSFNFFGVFNSYNFPEYIFYMLLGFGFIYLPKLWNKEENTYDNIKDI